MEKKKKPRFESKPSMVSAELKNRNKQLIHEEIYIYLEGHNLLTPCFLELFVKSDDKDWESLGKTENCMTKIHNFLISFRLFFSFETSQRLKIYYYHNDIVVYEKIVQLSKLLRIGMQRLDLRFQVSTKITKSNQPIISLRAENRGAQNDFLSFSFAAKLENISYFIPTVYFTIIHSGRENKSNYFALVKSESAYGFSVIWPEYSISLLKLCGNDLERNLEVCIWMKRWIFADKLLGVVKLQVSDLIDGLVKSMEIRDQMKKEVGYFFFSKTNYQRKPTFLDYVINGLDLKLILGLDYSSIHDLQNTNDGNSISIRNIVEILTDLTLEFDNENKIITYGLGSHHLCFNNGSEIEGKKDNKKDDVFIDVFKTYSENINKVNNDGFLKLEGFFFELERKIHEENRKNANRLKFFIVAIIVDSISTDFLKSLDHIIKWIQEMPVCIKFIVKGKNNLDFVRNAINGKKLKRKIIQYIEIGTSNTDNYRIKKMFFKNIPKMIVDYYYSENIIPISTTARNCKSENLPFMLVY